MRKMLCLAVSVGLGYSPSAMASGAMQAIETLGLIGTWATYCTDNTPRGQPGMRIVFAGATDGSPSYTTVISDGRETTTVHSAVLDATPAAPGQLKLRLRITGGDVEGRPLPETMTNTFEQVIERDETRGIQLVNVDPRFIQKCPD